MAKVNKIESGRLIEKIRRAIKSGEYRDTFHSAQRQSSRLITRLEIEYVLLNGWHEKRKDAYDENYYAWNYAIRGKTIDSRNLRIIVSFDVDEMLIITAIDLDKDD